MNRRKETPLNVKLSSPLSANPNDDAVAADDDDDDDDHDDEATRMAP